APEACDAVVALAPDADAHRIDAVSQLAGRVKPQIGGRIAELAAALVAMHNLAADEPRIAERARRLLDMARREPPADRPGGDAPAAARDRRHDVHCEVAPRALRREQIRRAGAVLAKTEIVAHDRAGDAETVEQGIVDEILRRGLRQRGVEGQDDRTV